MKVVDLADHSMQQFREAIDEVHNSGRQALEQAGMGILVKAYQSSIVSEAKEHGYERMSEAIPTYMLQPDHTNKNAVLGYSAFKTHVVGDSVPTFSRTCKLTAALPVWFTLSVQRVSVQRVNVGNVDCIYGGDIDRAMDQYVSEFIGYDVFPIGLLLFPISVIALLMNTEWRVTEARKITRDGVDVVCYTFSYGFRDITFTVIPSVVHADWQDYRARIDKLKEIKNPCVDTM